MDEIEKGIQRAEALFAAIDHVHGPIDCTRARAELDIDRNGAGLDTLERCTTAYQDIGFPRGAISTLMDMANHALRRGDSSAAERYDRALIEQADAVGMRMQRQLVSLSYAELAMRHGLHSQPASTGPKT